MKYGIAVLMLLAGCAPVGVIPTSVTHDYVSFHYDALINSWNQVEAKAKEMCGTPVKTIAKWDNAGGGTKGATFQCERGPT